MTLHALSAPSIVDRIKTTLVGLRMPRALEIVDVIVRQLERGETTALEAIDSLLMEELTLRETRRVKTALVMARLSTLKTLSGFDFTFQPSLDRGRIMALAELKFIDRSEAVHFVGPPGTGKSHLGVALGVEAVRPDAASTSSPWPISSTPLHAPSGKARCARKSASTAGLRCLSSTRSATSRSSPAVATCSSNWSTRATSAAR
jgi:IstB-like ATP binding protein